MGLSIVIKAVGVGALLIGLAYLLISMGTLSNNPSLVQGGWTFFDWGVFLALVALLVPLAIVVIKRVT